MLRALSVRARAFLLCSAYRLSDLFRRLLGTRLYYENFSPDRSLIIKSSCSSREIRINVYEPNEFDKNQTYPTHINLHGETCVRESRNIIDLCFFFRLWVCSATVWNRRRLLPDREHPHRCYRLGLQLCKRLASMDPAL